MMVASIEKNIMEHISLMSQEQIEIEFAQELQTVAITQTCLLYTSPSPRD